jgi:hypothetical protein
MDSGPLLPRILCIPVSGAYGMGEYARSLAIARAVSARWPDAPIHFALSRAAPYAADIPYPCTLLPASPTFHTPEVVALIGAFAPTLVLFDNAGRTAQLAAARASGARVVFISARRRQRRKAFRLGWMRLLDEHWIAYPALVAGALGWHERLKLALCGRPAVRFLDVILTPADAGAAAAVLTRFSLGADGFVLVVPGGGTGHPRAVDAAQRFDAAAVAVAAAGTPTVFVGPGAPGDAPRPSALRECRSLPQAQLIELMRRATLVIANGGSTLLQAIACGRPTLAIPIADDQPARIARCVAAGVCVAAPLDADAIAQRAASLIADAALRAALGRSAAALGLADGLDVAVRAIARLHDPAGAAGFERSAAAEVRPDA